jgi:ribA/ribD-fused uncharacterized protein
MKEKNASPLSQPQNPSSIPEAINSFKGDFGFLSNFHEASLWWEGKQWRSVEHAYQAAKFSDESSRELVRVARTPAAAKQMGKSAQLPEDWDAKKIDIMRTLVREKFKNPLLRSMLLATGEVYLAEGNWWGDRVWGICKGTGLNWLGKILMEVREECRREEESDND